MLVLVRPSLLGDNKFIECGMRRILYALLVITANNSQRAFFPRASAKLKAAQLVPGTVPGN